MQANWLIAPLVASCSTAVLPTLPTQLDMCQNKSNKKAASAASITLLGARGTKDTLYIPTHTSHWHPAHNNNHHWPIKGVSLFHRNKKTRKNSSADTQPSHSSRAVRQCCAPLSRRDKMRSHIWYVAAFQSPSGERGVACRWQRWPITAYYRCLRIKAQERRECRRRLLHKTLAALI